VKIAVNTRLLLKDKLEGIGWFTFENLKRITLAHPEHTFLFIFDREFDESFIFADNIEPIVIGPQARHPILFKWWFNRSIPKVLKAHDADLFFSPDGYLSLKTHVPQVAVIHDLNFEHYPKDLKKHITKYYRKYFPRFARKATRILTVSQFSKEDIMKQYGIESGKIDVVYNGVNEAFGPTSIASQEEIRSQYTDGKPYFIFVGALHPRKNISRLLEAFDQAKKTTGSDHKLVLVGGAYWWNHQMENTLQSMEHKDDVIFQGSVSGSTLNALIGSADAMTFVPYFEGFGIPILEAFKCETLLISGNLTSLPEVAGDAGLMVDPFDVNEIAEAITQVMESKVDREELLEKGRKQLSQFSWDQTAEKVWKSIEKVLTQS
jgi:glycosyltransferase involved in cell wall biosynthesis